MEPIHKAAWDGDVAAIDRLVAEDGGRLNAEIQVVFRIGGIHFQACIPLMLGAYRSKDAVVARLLALGAEVGLQSVLGSLATHWARFDAGSAARCRCFDDCAQQSRTDPADDGCFVGGH